MPPSRAIKPYQKHAVMTEYALRFGPKIFIETGTFRGDTIKAMLISKHKFDRLWTIDTELSRAQRAKNRFHGCPSVTCLHGDSGKVLPEVMKGISEPCLFWLDAHYAGTKFDKFVISAPIKEELKCILEHPYAAQHTILIDDAWYFTDKVYVQVGPSVAELLEIVQQHFPTWTFDIELDIIRVNTHGDDAKTG